MSYETLPGVQLQLPQYHFPETHIAPRPNIWPGIIQGIAQLAKTAEDLSPQEQEKKTLENLELRYKTNVFQRQLANSGSTLLDADGLPMYKPNGEAYSYAEHQEMKARKQEMEQRDLAIQAAKGKLNPPGKTSGMNDAWATPKKSATISPAITGTPDNPSWLGAPVLGVDTVDPTDISNYKLAPPVSQPTSSLFDPIPQFVPDTTPEDYHSALNNDEVLAT